MSISPLCTVDGFATPVDVASSGTSTIALASSTGVNYWSIACTSTDETNTAAAVNATLVVNMGAKTATFTRPAAGSALIFTSTVGINNLGLDANNVVQSPFTTTFEVHVKTAGGNRVIAANETFEANASFGYVPKLNAVARVGGASFAWGGDGSSGAATLDGVATVAWAALTGGNTYTMSQDVLASTLTVNAGQTLILNGFKLFVSGTLTNNGTIHNDGNPARSSAQALSTNQNGTLNWGAAGGGTSSNGLDGGTGTGGHGGNFSGSGSAGGEGVYSPLTGNYGSARYLPNAILGAAFGLGITAGGGYQAISGGAGGGKGSSDGSGGTPATPGWGGGGGGVAVIGVNNLLNAGSIHCNGGVGGNAVLNNGTGAGGGGGGGGGTLYVIYRTLTGAGTIAVNGGAGGTPVGTGHVGYTGGAGNLVQIAA